MPHHWLSFSNCKLFSLIPSEGFKNGILSSCTALIYILPPLHRSIRLHPYRILLQSHYEQLKFVLNTPTLPDFAFGAAKSKVEGKQPRQKRTARSGKLEFGSPCNNCNFAVAGGGKRGKPRKTRKITIRKHLAATSESESPRGAELTKVCSLVDARWLPLWSSCKFVCCRSK